MPEPKSDSSRGRWGEWHVRYLVRWGLLTGDSLPDPGDRVPLAEALRILDRIAEDNGIPAYRRPSGTSNLPGREDSEAGAASTDMKHLTRLEALRAILSLATASATPPPTLAELDPRLENPGPAGPFRPRPGFWDRKEIPEEAWDEVVHAQRLNIARGYVDRTFRPFESIRWGEFAAFLIRSSYWLPSIAEE